MVFALLLGIASFTLGIAYTGAETAFYRVSKLRLKLDALGGDAVAKQFLRFTNNPGFFIATLLVGYNATTYGVSAAIVLFAAATFPQYADGAYTELVATLLLTPVLFVWGEMFPKCLGLTIPGKFLRFFSPLILFSCWLFLPLTAVLWGINKIIAILNKSEDTITMSLGRRELSGILAEGKDTGLLSDTQRRLAEGIFVCSDRLIKNYTLPQTPQPAVTTAMNPEYVLDIARKSQQLALPVYEPDADTENGDLPIGYVRTIDLEIAVRHQLDEQARQLSLLLQTELPLRSLVELSSRHSLLTGLILLQTMQDSFGCVVDEYRRCLGFISADQLRDVLLGTRGI